MEKEDGTMYNFYFGIKFGGLYIIKQKKDSNGHPMFQMSFLIQIIDEKKVIH